MEQQRSLSWHPERAESERQVETETTFDRQFELGNQRLISLQNSISFHEALEATPMGKKIIEESGMKVTDMFELPGTKNFVILRVSEGYDLDEIQENADNLLTSLGCEAKRDSDIIGYGTGENKVGFCKLNEVPDKVRMFGLGEDENLSLFIPVKITQEDSIEDNED